MKKILLLAAALLAIGVSPAHADPITAAIAWVGKAVSGVLAAGGIGAALMRTAIGIGVSLLAQALAPKPKRERPGVKFSVDTGDDTPLSFVVGKYATAGKRKYVGVWGDNNRYLTDVIELSALPQPDLVSMWIDDEQANILTGQTDTDGTPYDLGHPITNYANGSSNRIWVKFHDGTQTAADPMLVGAFGSDPDYPWTTDMVGTGKTYAIVTSRFDEETLTSPPAFMFEPAPLPLYDPRKDDTNGGSGTHRWGQANTYEPSTNPAVIAYNVARGIYYGNEWLFGGKNLSDWRLPVSEWFAAMNECDDLVSLAGGGSEPRYRCGMEINVSMSPADVLEEIGRSANMRFAEVGGLLKPIVGLPGAAVLSFTDESVLITEGQSFRPFNAISDTYNAISATYPEPGEKWSTKDAGEYVDPDATAADNGRYLPTSISYPAVPYGRQVRRLQRPQMRDFRRFRIHQFYLPPEAYALEPGIDTVSWTSERNGYLNKLFVVEAVSKTPGMNVLVSLREVDPSDYDWSSDFEVPVVVNTPVNPTVWTQPISGLTVTASLINDGAGQPRRPAITVACNGDEPGVTHIQIQARVVGQGDIVIDTNRRFSPPHIWYLRDVLPVTDYEVRARLLSERTPKSAWSNWLSVTTLDQRLTMQDMAEDVQQKMEETAELAGVTPVETLPASGDKPDQIVMKVPEGILYRWDDTADEWTRNLYTGIEDGSITTAKFAQGIEPVTVIPDSDPLPTTKSTESIFHDGKLYRWNGTEYVATVPVQDIDGKLPPSKLATIPGVNLFPDADGTDPDAWDAINGWQHLPNIIGGRWQWVEAGQTGNQGHASIPFVIEAGRRYRATMWSSLVSGTTGSLRFDIRWYDNTNTQIGIDHSGFQPPSANITAEGVAPSGARSARLLVIVDADATDGDIATNRFRVNLITGADLIEDAAISAQKIADGAVEAIKLATDAVTRDKIVADAISAVELADNAVTAAKIITDAITETKIQDGSISTPKLAAGSVTAGKIVAGAIQTSHVAANAIDASKIAANTITANEIAAEAIGAAQIAAGSIVASRLAVGDFSNFVKDSQIQDLGYWKGNATDAHVTHNASYGDNVADAKSRGAFVVGESATPSAATSILMPEEKAVPAEEFYSECTLRAGTAHESDCLIQFLDNAKAVLQADVSPVKTDMPWETISVSGVAPAGTAYVRMVMRVRANGYATGANIIFTGPVLRRKNEGKLVVDGAITATKIAANAIDASHVSAGSIETAALAAGAVTANKIAANSITASEIAADAITANELAAGSVSANHLQADSVTAGKVAAAAIGADQIAAQAIVASKLAVRSFDNLVPDADFEDVPLANNWTAANGAALTRHTAGTGWDARYLLRVTIQGASSTTYEGVRSSKFNVIAGQDYYLGAQLHTDDVAQVLFRLQWFDQSDASLGTSNVISGSANLAPGQGRYENTLTAPSGAVSAEAQLYIRRDSTATYVQTGALAVRKASGSELIVDGAISANHLAADSVTANAVAAGAIVTSALAAGAVTANKIAANTITSGQINVAELVGSNAFLDNLVVDTAQLANAAITTAKIGDAAIKTAKIGNLEVTRLKVADYAVTTFENVVTTGSVSFVANDWTQVASLVVNRTRGDPLPMFVRLDGGNSDMLVRIKRDGSVLSQIFPNTSNDWVSGITMTYIDRSNLTGSFTYTVEVYSGSPGSVSNRFLGVFNAHK